MLKKKNLVLIHLESLSNYIYNNNKQYFPNINEFSKHCINFTKFFSNATSTTMTLSDLMYGNIYRLEETKYYGKFEVKDYGKCLLEELAEQEYIVNSVIYLVKGVKEMKDASIFGNQNTFYNYNYGEFINQIDNCIIKNKNFALMVWDVNSHLEYYDRRKSKNSSNRWEKGYIALDETFGNLIKLLKRKNLMNDTIIVAYGDHGDDFYTKKFNSGMTHAIEPYTCLCHTPLFIYSHDIGYQENNSLVNSIDLKYIIKDMLYGKTLNQAIRKNTYIFSRNLFANQLIKKLDRIFEKGYTVINKNYNLILTNKGLEMYAYNMDPINCNNLLDFFTMDSKGNIYPAEFTNYYISGHFISILNKLEDIEKEFYFLRSKLKKELLQIYNKVNVEEKNKISMKAFNKIHYIHDYRNYHKYINKSNTLREIIKWINDFDDGKFLLKRKEYPN